MEGHFDKQALMRRAANLNRVVGPILIPGSSDDVDTPGALYYKPKTGRVDRQVAQMRAEHRKTYFFREFILRALDKDGDPIYQPGDLRSLLDGGIDPSDVGQFIGMVWSEADDTDLTEADEPAKFAPFSPEAARKRFAETVGLYGPVLIPHCGEDGQALEAYWRSKDGQQDCLETMIMLDHKYEADFRLLVLKALTRKGKRIFDDSEDTLTLLMGAITSKEASEVVGNMKPPRLMPDWRKLKIVQEREHLESAEEDDVKN